MNKFEDPFALTVDSNKTPGLNEMEECVDYASATIEYLLQQPIRVNGVVTSDLFYQEITEKKDISKKLCCEIPNATFSLLLAWRFIKNNGDDLNIFQKTLFEEYLRMFIDTAIPGFAIKIDLEPLQKYIDEILSRTLKEYEYIFLYGERTGYDPKMTARRFIDIRSTAKFLVNFGKMPKNNKDFEKHTTTKKSSYYRK
jgi:hypothetical protein